MTSESPWGLSHKELSHYFAFYHEIVPEGELLSGSRAREFFLLSNLPPSTLSHIWNLSDVDQDGQLGPDEFAVALHLTQLALDGLAPPVSLPFGIRSLLEKINNPDGYLSVIKPNQVQQCTSAFLSFVENDAGSGYLSGEAARYLLTNSQLPKAMLFHIWKLADTDRDGRLSFDEFLIAMHLVYVAKLDQPLPVFINPSIMLPDEFYSLKKKVATVIAQKPSINRTTAIPLLPPFVSPTDNPCVNANFKIIPSKRFQNGKFGSFTGDPFESTNNHEENNMNESNTHLSSSQGELSTSSSNSESVDISKHSSSQHSSVKSLVEEKDGPILQQAVSVEVDLQEISRTTPTQEKVDEESVTENVVNQEEIDAELTEISKASQKFLERNGPSPLPSPSEIPDPYVTDPEMKSASIKGLNSVISDISPEPPINNVETPTVVDTKTETDTKQTETETSTNQNGSQSVDLNFLAQLDDLEAQIMNVLDDTNTFDPMAEVTPPEPPPPAPILKIESTSSPKEDIRKKSLDDTDSVFGESSSMKSKSMTMPQKRTSKESSPSEFRSRGSSESSSETSPVRRRNTYSGGSPMRRKLVKSVVLDDLEDIFTEELASIESMMEARQNRDEESEQRIKRENEEINIMEKKAMKAELPMPQLTSMEEVARRRSIESAQKQREWEKEMEELEREAKQKYEEQLKKVQLLDDESIHDLESQFEELLEHEAKSMKDARVIRAQRLKELQKEDEEKRERMRKKFEGKTEITIEEWIEMMEKNKVREMTPEVKEKYEKKKTIWLQKRREKEEQLKAEAAEKLRRNKQMMNEEISRQYRIEQEVRNSRMTKEQLQELEKELIKKEAVERKTRSEQARQRIEEIKQREIEERKPKARSAIAARWEEKVKYRTSKEYDESQTGFLKSVSTREEERLSKRVGKLT